MKTNTITNELENIFEEANKNFINNSWMLFDTKVSERTLCGALMIELHEVLKKTRYSDYFVDVEYNRNGGKIKTIKKTIETIDAIVVPINCDLIIHSRGQNISRDNLIAIEMKKSNRPQIEKDNDRMRLVCLTKNPGEDVWSYDGKTLPEHVCGYELGIYYEINYGRREILIEYYKQGYQYNYYWKKIYKR